MTKDPRREVYANFRVSIDDGFRNEFSFVHYRRWGEIELWEGGRFRGPPPRRQQPSDCIEVWHNWELVGTFKSRSDAQALVRRLRATAPASLDELADYL